MNHSPHINELIQVIRGSDPGDSAPSANAATFDGVICFGGEDWWYHNHGHYDMQMMRELSHHLPVLYVNSIGMRMPRPGKGRMFLTRMRRKLRSLRRGLVHQQNGMSILSPPALPGVRGVRLTRALVVRYVLRACRELGITRPLVWVACPTAADLVERLDPAAVVYQRTDRYECYDGVDETRIRSIDRRLKEEADLTLFCSRHLFEQEAGDCRRALRVDHGIDEAFFRPADTGETAEPPDIACLPRPRVGFVGGIDHHTFDAALFQDVAQRLPHCRFVMIGASSIGPDARSRPNITWLGQRPFADVPRYMSACDVLIMPWHRSHWIEACNPIKLKEYLASGRPVVSTPFPELLDYEGLVHVARDAEAFAAAILEAIARPGDSTTRRDRVRGATWADQAKRVLDRLAERNLVPFRGNHAAAPPLRLSRPTVATSEGFAAPVIGRIGVSSATATALPDAAVCILLAGGLRPSALIAASGRSVLDQPLPGGRTIGSEWIDRIASLAEATNQTPLIRIVHDSRMPPPWPIAAAAVDVIVEREPRALRGPAGVLHDLCRDLAPETQLLVAEAARYVVVSLIPFHREHEESGADISVAANPDGSPAGIYLIRRRALDLVSTVGYVDLKEQLIPCAISAGLEVRVHHLPAPGALPIRTAAALRTAAAHVDQTGVAADALAFNNGGRGPDHGRTARRADAVEAVDAFALTLSDSPSPSARGRP